MSRPSQRRGIVQKPLRSLLDLSHFVRVGDVLVVTQRFPPELANDSPLSLCLDCEEGRESHSRYNAFLNEKLRPRDNVVPLARCRPSKVKYVPSPLDRGEDVATPGDRGGFRDAHYRKVRRLQEHFRA